MVNIQGGPKKVIPLIQWNIMYERYHFFGPPCIPDRGQILRRGHHKLFGVIRGNSAADERIFTKFGVYMDNGTHKAALWSTWTTCEIQNRETREHIFGYIAITRPRMDEFSYTYVGSLIADFAQ